MANEGIKQIQEIHGIFQLKILPFLSFILRRKYIELYFLLICWRKSEIPRASERWILQRVKYTKMENFLDSFLI